ncbi:MAG: hypothetical protein V5A55_07220 [Halovenus sp.]
MARLMTQFAVGALLTTLVIHVFVPGFRYKRTAVVAGGAWALIPDLYLLFPVFEDTLRWLSDAWLADLFWFHGTLNRRVTGNEFRRVGAFAITVYALVVVGTDVLGDRTHRALSRVTTWVLKTRVERNE